LTAFGRRGASSSFRYFQAEVKGGGRIATATCRSFGIRVYITAVFGIYHAERSLSASPYSVGAHARLDLVAVYFQQGRRIFVRRRCHRSLLIYFLADHHDEFFSIQDSFPQ